MWEALNYGQVVYAIKTRNGQVYMKLKRNFGDMTQLEVSWMPQEEGCGARLLFLAPCLYNRAFSLQQQQQRRQWW